MELADKLNSLRHHQQTEILKLVNKFIANNSISPLQKLPEDICCSACSSKHYVKNGLRGNKQRYKCKVCSFSFTTTTNTSIHYLHKTDVWTDFVYLLLKSPVPPTLIELSKQLSLSTKTAHVWKHRFLASLNESDEIVLENEIELDEVFLPFCVKGKLSNDKSTKIIKKEIDLLNSKQNVMFLCVHNRNKDFDFLPIKIQQKGALSLDTIKPVIDLLNIKKDTVVITDKAKATVAYFKKRKDVSHECFKSNGEKTSRLHNNNINSTMSMFNAWSKRFSGFSTKYIWNYLKWFRFHRKFMLSNDLDTIISETVADLAGFNRYVLIPKYYEEFIFAA